MVFGLGLGLSGQGLLPVPPPIVTVSLGSALSSTAHGNRTNWTPVGTNLITDPVSRSGLKRQFAVWYDSQPSNSKITIARRTRPEAELTNWSAWTLQAATVTNSGAVADAHFFPSLGVRASGVLVLTWRAHNAEEAFCWVGDDIDDITVDHTNAVLTSQGLELQSTYWRWFYQSDGVLCATHRVGPAGDDAQQVQIRDNGTDFTLLHTGHSPPGFMDWPAGGDQESPYMDRLFRNAATGRTHYSGSWAQGGDLTKYHDKFYFYTDDDGDSFKYIDGTSVTLPIGGSATHPKSIAWTIPMNSGMPVHHCTAAMADDQPIITYYAADDADDTKTNIYALTYYQGAWHRRIVYSQPGYSLVDDTDPPEPLEITNIMCLHKNGVTFVWYANSFLGPGFWVQCSRDKGLQRWSAPVQLINVTNDYGSAVLDDSAFWHFGEIYMYVQEDNGALAENYVARVTLA